MSQLISFEMLTSGEVSLQKPILERTQGDMFVDLVL